MSLHELSQLFYMSIAFFSESNMNIVSKTVHMLLRLYQTIINSDRFLIILESSCYTHDKTGPITSVLMGMAYKSGEL